MLTWRVGAGRGCRSFNSWGRGGALDEEGVACLMKKEESGCVYVPSQSCQQTLHARLREGQLFLSHVLQKQKFLTNQF